MRIYTIGFTKKSAEQFFCLLKKNNIKFFLDIRLNNSSQLSGFAKGSDLKFFLKNLLKIEYRHDIRFAPTKEILDGYKKKNITWNQYETEFLELMNSRNFKKIIADEYSDQLDGVCLLCSEPTAEKCHRRLVAEKIQSHFPNIEIIHL